MMLELLRPQPKNDVGAAAPPAPHLSIPYEELRMHACMTEAV